MDLDLKNLGGSLSAQFRDLSGRHPGLWPIAPRLLCGLGVVIAVGVLGHFAYWDSQFKAHEAGAKAEKKLRAEYEEKMAQAINLEALREQKAQVDRYVDQLQKQLPSKAEMAALLSDITHAGLGRGLQFDLFKPGQVLVKDYYAELPITIKVSGSYHAVGAFAGDMANMPRIVTLNNMSLAQKDGTLVLDATAKTFRYLDPEEVSAQRQAQADAKSKAKGAKGAKAKKGSTKK